MTEPVDPARIVAESAVNLTAGYRRAEVECGLANGLPDPPAELVALYLPAGWVELAYKSLQLLIEAIMGEREQRGRPIVPEGAARCQRCQCPFWLVLCEGPEDCDEPRHAIICAKCGQP